MLTSEISRTRQVTVIKPSQKGIEEAVRQTITPFTLLLTDLLDRVHSLTWLIPTQFDLQINARALLYCGTIRNPLKSSLANRECTLCVASTRKPEPAAYGVGSCILAKCPRLPTNSPTNARHNLPNP